MACNVPDPKHCNRSWPTCTKILKKVKRAMLVYLADYKQDEENAMRQGGVAVARIPKPESSKSWKLLAAIPRTCELFIRSRKYTLEEFSQVWSAAANAGVSLSDTPQSFKLGIVFSSQIEVLKEYSPPSLARPRTNSTQELIDALVTARLQPPLFVRSNVESAAKYVGIDACIVKQLTSDAIEGPVQALKKYVVNFDEIIFKQLVAIRKVADGKATIEVRAIVLGGEVIMFDAPFEMLPDEQSQLQAFATAAVNSLKQQGGTGAYFIDLGFTESGSVIVVECKNFSNGNVKDLSNLIQQLSLRWRTGKSTEQAL